MRYKGLDLNLLHALDVLLEVRNVTHAADRLALSQSALSAALARLRQFFGDELLVLDGRRMHPTPFAEQIIGPVRACLQGADTVLNTGRIFEAATSDRTFRIIASDYIVTAVLSKLTERFATQAPGIRLEFISPDSGSIERIERGDVDLMISPRDYLLPSHPMEDLFEEQIVVAGWNENPVFAHGLTEEDFFEAGHITVTLGNHRESTFADRYVESLGRPRRVEAIASSFTVVPWMLQGTRRLSLMHKRLAETLAEHLPIRHAPIPFTFPTMWEGVQYHRTRGADGGLKWLIDHIRMTATEA